MWLCTVAEGVSVDVKVQGGAMSDSTLAGGVSVDVKVQGGAMSSVYWLEELVRM
jgi:hypothetical protein